MLKVDEGQIQGVLLILLSVKMQLINVLSCLTSHHYLQTM